MRWVRAVLVLALAIVSASPAGALTIGVSRAAVRVESSAGRLR